jgi:hypothetical protein
MIQVDCFEGVHFAVYLNNSMCANLTNFFRLKKTIMSVETMSNSLLNLYFWLIERKIESHLTSNLPQISLGMSLYGYFYVPLSPSQMGILSAFNCVSLRTIIYMSLPSQNIHWALLVWKFSHSLFYSPPSTRFSWGENLTNYKSKHSISFQFQTSASSNHTGCWKSL